MMKFSRAVLVLRVQSTKYPEDEDRDGLRNVGFFTAQPADSPRELHHLANLLRCVIGFIQIQ
jgi:hypothetical protein